MLVCYDDDDYGYKEDDYNFDDDDDDDDWCCCSAPTSKDSFESPCNEYQKKFLASSCL